jgi:hypothetical protein
MTRSPRFVFSLLATMSIGMALAQTSTAQTSESTAAAASGAPGALVAPFGVPLAPPIYLINFLLLYVSNPENAAYMPAYRVALPQEVFKCLADNPDGCPYAAMAPYFAEQADGGSQNQKTLWPSSCQTSPSLAILAPRQYRQPEQINQPLGKKDADQLAKLLGIKQDMILTDQEYQCLIGAPPRDVEREVIYACTLDLTNSNGNTGNMDIPLSSYGLYRNLKGDVRSDCAPQAPCLEFNKLFAGPLEVIAKQCGFADKLARLVSETPFLEFAREGSQCQHASFPTSCIAEAPCVGKGSPSNNECAPPIAPK